MENQKDSEIAWSIDITDFTFDEASFTWAVNSAICSRSPSNSGGSPVPFDLLVSRAMDSDNDMEVDYEAHNSTSTLHTATQYQIISSMRVRSKIINESPVPFNLLVNRAIWTSDSGSDSEVDYEAHNSTSTLHTATQYQIISSTRQKIVIKVQMHCSKCQRKAFTIALIADGVTSVCLQGAERDQLVVTGYGVDAVDLARALRKKLHLAYILSVVKI